MQSVVFLPHYLDEVDRGRESVEVVSLKMHQFVEKSRGKVILFKDFLLAIESTSPAIDV